MATATYIKNLAWNGDARLYSLDTPVPYGGLNDEDGETQYVVVSAVIAPFSGPETYIFPVDEHGSPINMLELEGSFKGGLDHHAALKSAGFDEIMEDQE